MAKQKLQTALENEQNKGFAEPTIKHLLGVCDTDPEFAELVLQEHKTWAKCSDYIYQQARAIKSKDSNCVGVEDKTVYKWAEDYFRKDDKAEEEAKAKAEAERKAKAEAEAKKQAEEAKKKKAKKPQKKQTAPKEPAPAEQKKEPAVEVKPKTVRKKAEGVKPKAKKKKAEEVNDNALSLFDLM